MKLHLPACSSLFAALLSLNALLACGSSGDSEDTSYTPGGAAKTGKGGTAGSGGSKTNQPGVAGSQSGGQAGGSESCDGLDNNKDGQVDEGCSCTPGKTQACYLGPAATRHVGECKDGQQTCSAGAEFGRWGACMGSIAPQAEVADGKDNDCNGAPDDLCGENKPKVAEVCGNGMDDDCDGKIDCDDPPDCPPCREGNCSDGVDDDQDGLVDCKDTDCKCQEDCGNGSDDDGDGLVDCQDTDCAGAAECQQVCGPNGECCNGKDDNGDGRIDEGNVCDSVGEPCPPGAFQACDCYCGVHRKCTAEGTWGPCMVDGNGSCAVAKITSQSQCTGWSVCDYGECTFGGFGGQCVHHSDCPKPMVCDLGECVMDPYSPCK